MDLNTKNGPKYKNGSKIKNICRLFKMSHLDSSIIMAFSTNFCTIKIDLPGNTVWPLDRKFFKKSSRLDHFWHFLKLLSTQNEYGACNIKWDFFYDFHSGKCEKNSGIFDFKVHEQGKFGKLCSEFLEFHAAWIHLE